MSNPPDPPHEEPTQAWGHPTAPGWGRPIEAGNQPQPPYGAQPAYGAPNYQPVHVPPPQHPSAMTAMGLGIFSLVGGFTCYLPVLAAPFAWVVGRNTVREIDAEPGRWSGRELANAGRIMGMVATILLVLGLVAVVVGISILLYTN
ncbi:hypothetical protein ASG90_10765 [Nocardioides sp. Soil797]|nr:hypothetical protein ASG90_10765 [Nocardioides sp. Soil797]